MAEYTFYMNPMSRAQIARWALHEVEADYEPVLVEWGNKPAGLLAANPMGKLPTIVHHTSDGDRVVTEAAAICTYLAEMHPETGLLPSDEEKADYLRWLFFAAGPVEQAITAKALGFEPRPEQERMAGFGNYDRTVATLEDHLEKNRFVCGDRFTMADVYVGSTVDWGLSFGTLPGNDVFEAYAGRVRERPGYKAGKAIDNKMIEEMQK